MLWAGAAAGTYLLVGEAVEHSYEEALEGEQGRGVSPIVAEIGLVSLGHLWALLRLRSPCHHSLREHGRHHHALNDRAGGPHH